MNAQRRNKHTGNKQNHRQLKNTEQHQNGLARQIISAVTALGIFANPLTAAAQITAGADFTKVTTKDNVTDIATTKIIERTGVNVFNEFKLDANKIANMYFGDKANSNQADKLVNFVNSRIDINGTVNAVQNSKISGSLYFLSKDGMAVGSSGVINTGALFTATPTAQTMDKLTKIMTDASDDAQIKTELANITGDGWNAIPVNAAGTITVLGKINAVDRIDLRTAKIEIGNKANKNAALTTGVADFADLVNIKANGSEIKAGLDNNLQATMAADSGDIVLTALANEVNGNDDNFTAAATPQKKNLVQAFVKSEGTISAAGDAKITATATSGMEYGDFFVDGKELTSGEMPLEVWGQVIKTDAAVDINGSVTGQHVDIQANSANKFISAGKTAVSLSDINAVIGSMSINVDGAYGILGSTADVNIGNDAIVTATAKPADDAKALNITANSTLKAGIGASTSAIKWANFKHAGNVPATAVTFAKTDNAAKVTVAGKLSAQGKTNIGAVADSVLEASAVDKTKQVYGGVNDGTVINAAVVSAKGTNSSKVEIQKTATITDIQGELTIAASSLNNVDTQALVGGQESSLAATAVNITDYDSQAAVKIDSDLQAAAVDIKAANVVTKNNVTANNSVGKNVLMSGLTNMAKGSLTAKTVGGAIESLKNEIMQSSPTTATMLDTMGQKLSLGASVAVVNESNTASVTVTKDAGIGAQDSAGTKGKISITADNTIADTQMKATGATSNYGTDSQNQVMVNASVLYADMDNDASVVLEGGDKNGQYVKLDGADISIRANGTFQYNRVNKMIGDILNLCSKLEAAYASNATYKAHATELKQKAAEYKEKLAADPDYANSTEGNAAAEALAAAAQTVSADAADGSVSDQIKDIFTGPFSVVGMAAQFADPANYANFQAASSTGGKSNPAAKVAVSGSANVNDLTNNAKVVIGKNSKIEGSGKVDLKATVTQKDVALNGKIAITSGAGDAMGGVAGVHFGKTDSLVAVAEGVQISGSAINAKADNAVSHTAITMGAGKGSKVGLTGMAGYMQGSSNSLVSIDDEAALTATEAKTDIKARVNDGSVNIDAQNTTTLTNVAGGGAMGKTAGIGASVAITDYKVNNIAAIADNDTGAVREKGDEVADLTGLVDESLAMTAAEKAELLGSKSVQIGDAGISAQKLNVTAHNDSSVNTVTVAGSLVMSSDSDTPGILDKFENFIGNTKNKIQNQFNKLDNAINNKLTGEMNTPGILKTDQGATNPSAGQTMAKFSVSGAGSASVNLINGTTAAVIDGTKIRLHQTASGDAAAVKAQAVDDSFIGAWGGAAGISWKNPTIDKNWNTKSVGLSGAVAVNETDTRVVSLLQNSTFNAVDSISNIAQKSGALVAAGLGLTLDKGGQAGGQNYAGAASVSVNLGDNKVHAIMAGNTVNNAEDSQKDGKTVLTNSAYDNDTQVTGGINASLALGGDKGVALGGTVTVATLTNDVKAQIRGGSYKKIGTADVSAITDLTQVGAAVGVAVAASGSSGSGSNYGFEGVAAYNQLNNTAAASIDDAELTVDKIGVTAKDTDLGTKKYDQYISDRGLDATGATYLENIKDTADDNLQDTKGNLHVGQTGNTIVTAALGVTGNSGQGGGSASAAASISDINNDFTAAVNGSTIMAGGLTGDTTGDVNVLAKTDTLLVGAAAGVGAAAKSFGGAASLTWQTLDNDTTATIENSNIQSASTAVNAVNGALDINAAGQVSVGKTALGLALAYNKIANTTGAYLKGSTLRPLTDTAGIDVAVKAENGSKLYAVGAGVGISKDQAAANGTIAVNRGRNDTEAIIDKSDMQAKTNLQQVQKLTVTAEDKNQQFALAGGVGGAKSAAVGGAVAYNEVGDISGAADRKQQLARAQINNTELVTRPSATIEVKATDASKLTTIGIGVGIAKEGAAVEGAAATALVNKKAEASLSSTNITAAGKNAAMALVTVEADSKAQTVSNASVIAATTKGAAIGAGVTVNRSEADVDAFVSGGQQQVQDLTLKASSRAMIENIGIGGGVAGGIGASIAGSVAVNMIDNDVTAKIRNGTRVAAANNVVVTAASDELISNYAGVATVTATGAAIGASVSVNQIDGSTAAGIEGAQTSVVARGTGAAAKVNDKVEDKNILNNFVDKDAFEGQASLADARTASTYHGVAVAASSTHSIKSFLVNASVAGKGVSASGNVNVNQVGGKTTAAIKEASVNQGLAAAELGDVNVRAHDYTNAAGIVGMVNVAGVGVGVGLGSDTSTLARTTAAEISGGKDTRNSVAAKDLHVQAEARQGISSLIAGVAVGGEGVGASNATGVALMQSTTKASIERANITTDNLSIEAEHAGKINTLGVAAGVAGIGAGVGIGVSVLNENSDTEALVNDTKVTYTGTNGKTAISSVNRTGVNYQLYNAGAGLAGVAGSVGVANVNSKVKTDVTNTWLGTAVKPDPEAEANQTGSIDVSSSNDINFTQKAGTVAGGGGGIGVGVTVNTIDSQVATTVVNSLLNAKDKIDVTATENRTVSQMAVNGAVGMVTGGANVMITNIGKAVDNVYGFADKEVQVGNIYKEANGAINGNRLSSAYMMGGINSEEVEAVKGVVAAGTGDKKPADKSMVKTKIDGATLHSGGLVKVASTEATNVTMDAINAQGSLTASVSGAVGLLDMHGNSGVEITSGIIDAESLNVAAIQKGSSALNIYQGTIGGIASLGAAYGRINAEGKTGVGIGNSQFTATKNITVEADDAGSSKVSVIGVALAEGGSASVIIAEGKNSSTTSIKVDKSEFAAQGDVDISAERQAKDEQGNRGTSLEASATAASGGLIFAGAGVSAQATEQGAVTIDVTSGNNLMAGKKLAIKALNAPAVKAATGAISGSMLAAASVTVAQANIGSKSQHLKTSVTIGDNNVLAAETISVKAENNAKQDVDMKAMSISASPFGGAAVQVNTGGADIYSDVTVLAGLNTYRGKTLDGGGYDTVDLALEGSNSVTQNVGASGVSAGAVFATGTNLANSYANLTTDVTAKGSKEDSQINDLTVNAKSYARIKDKANGYGGALIDISPFAAKVDNNYQAKTAANINGNWDTAGTVDTQAVNGSDIDLDSDAVRAAIIGGSGVWLKNVMNNTADITVKNAAITSAGAQKYLSQNNIDYNGTIAGSGYGGLNVNATDFRDDFDFTAGVTIDNSTLKGAGDSGAITVQALTSGAINSRNGLKSAGVIPISLAFSYHDVNYNNQIKIDKSTLTTAKKDQDITLAANDDTDVKLETIADTQGGVVGAASASVSNNLQRANKISLGAASRLESTNDVNLYAGANSGGINSALDLEVLADAYNKTLLPLCTRPKVKNVMAQNNQVEIAGNVDSVRHVNVKAGKGTTTVTESNREYNIYTGTGGSGSVASTALGEKISSETTDNYVNVSGTVKSGIHNKLEVDIGGATTKTEPTYEGDKMVSSGGISYDDIKIEVKQGSEWFDKNSITPADMVIANGLMARYKEVSDLMQAYNVNSSEYKGYANELKAIIYAMQQAGMVALDKDGTQSEVPVSQLDVPAIRLPDIVVSGGNINVEADLLKGNGSLTAQGAPQLRVTNNSDLYLAVGDLTIKDAGGQLQFNDSKLQASSTGNQFKGTTHADGVDTSIVPTITVEGTSPSAFTGNQFPQADIGVFGNITNTPGDIKISNANYSVLVQGNISAKNITLAAANGSVTQTSSTGLVNIGGDPVSRYQFSDSVAKKIQNYFYQHPDVKSKTFNSYDEYKNWLKSTVGISDSELNYQSDESAGIVAGDNVYINGLNVNVGGLVQSGYGNYTTTLNKEDAARVTQLDQKWAANKQPLSDNEVMSNNDYCINAGGKVWNSTTKVWDYEVKVYYNPSTKQLLTDSIAPNGGKIYLTGKVSSTGGGRLMAMDGAANIAIDTVAVDRKVKVHTITNNDISGLVSITDKNTSKVTEYANGRTRSYAVGTAADKLPAWSSGSSDYTYNPQQNLQYQWTGGVTGETIKKYSYSEKFLFWGLLDYSKTSKFVEGLRNAGKDYKVTTSSGTGQSMATGSVINTGTGGAQLKIDASAWTTNDEELSSVTADKQYAGTAGKIFGYGTTYYYWTGKQGTASATTSSLKADYGIKVGFLGNGDGSGNIKVTSQDDLLLAGNIANAAVIENNKFKGLGSVTLNSSKGSVSSLGNAKITSDEVNIQAATGIAVNHAAVGDSAVVNAVTDNGNIRFISEKGDLKIRQMTTGGDQAVDATTGNIYLQADGSILDAATADKAAIKGQRIDLYSNTGSIGTKEKALTVLGGSDIFSGDSMTSSINATADGDIVLTQTAGNMRLGTIESTNGDAVLTVVDGSFVDAYNVESSGLSDSAAKVERWLDSGLISSDDADDSSSEAAVKAKEERLSGLDSRAEALAAGNTSRVQVYKNEAAVVAKDKGLQQAKAVYTEAVQKAAGISDATEKEAVITAAYKEYQEAQQQYFAGKGYSQAEAELITSYAEVSTSNNYGWSKNQLLYAIQDSVINSTPGQVQTVDKANVSAKNITLNASNGAVGIDGAAKEIGYAYIDQLDNLKLLAASKAGDLTWNNEKKTVTVTQQQSINLQSKNANGQIEVTGRDNVYLAGTKDTVLNVTGIETGHDIKLMSYNGVNMVGKGILKGVNLIINGGNGNVGSAAKHIVTDISGTLDANSKKSVYIDQKGQVLNIQAVAAGEDVVLSAEYGLRGSTAEGKNAGYINAGNEITLESSAGSIGLANDGIRILNNGAVVNAFAKENVYLSGRNSGELVLGKITAGTDFGLESAGNVKLGRSEQRNEQQEVMAAAVAGEVQAGNDGKINAVNIDLDNGSIVLAKTGSSLLLQATGDIAQKAEAGGIKTDKLHTVSAGKQKLLSRNNAVNTWTAASLNADHSINGGVEFVSSSANGLQATLDDLQVQNGNVSITNIATNADLAVTGSIKVDGKEQTNGDISFTGQRDVVTNNSLETVSGTVTINAGRDIKDAAAVKAAQAVTMTAASGDITNNGIVSAGTTLTMLAGKGSIANKAAVTSAGGTIKLTAQKDITNDAAVTNSGQGQDIVITAADGSITNKADVISAGGAVQMAAGQNITNTSTDAAVKAANAVELTATNNIENKARMSSGAKVQLGAGNNIDNSGGVTAAEAIGMTAGNDLSNNGALTADKKNIELRATQGNLAIGANGTILAKLGDISLATQNSAEAGKGNITVRAGLHAQENMNINVDHGNVLLAADADVQNGTLKITVEDGFIKSTHSDTGDHEMGQGVQLSSINGNVDIYTQHGDVDLHEIYAKNKAAAGTESGRLRLCKINGDIVALVTKDMNRDMDVKEIVAGSHVILSGNRINLDDIQQRKNADGLLLISPESGDPNEPMEKFNIKNIDTGNGIRFDKLWVKNSEINVNNGRFYIEKLAVADVAYFSNRDTHTAVYGTPPQRGNSDSIYWFNYSVDSPKSDLAGWHQDGYLGKWMNLYFTDRYHTQLSNGVLIALKDFYYAYDERATGENHLQKLMEREMPQGIYAVNYHPDVAFYQRFGLYDLPDIQPDNEQAEEDQIIISEEI